MQRTVNHVMPASGNTPTTQLLPLRHRDTTEHSGERSEEPEHQKSLWDCVSKKEQRSFMVCKQYSFLIMTLIRTTSTDLLNGRGKLTGPHPQTKNYRQLRNPGNLRSSLLPWWSPLVGYPISRGQSWNHMQGLNKFMYIFIPIYINIT